MKRVFTARKVKKLYPGTSGLILALGALIIGVWTIIAVSMYGTPAGEVAVAQAAAGDAASGFLWSDTLGWISLNCSNDWDGNGIIGAGEDRCGGAGAGYGVDVETLGRSGELTGFGWSPNAGLICFGKDCPGTTPDGSTLAATFEFPAGQSAAAVVGWARLEGHASQGGDSQGGWVRLNGTAPGPVAIKVTARVEGTAQDNSMVFSGSGWQSNADSTGAGWLDADFESSKVPLGVAPCPLRENECLDGVNCCSNGIDDDCDLNYTITDERDPPGALDALLTGIDCTDYDCSGAGSCPSREDTNANGTVDFTQCFDELDNDLDAYASVGGVMAQVGATLLIDCADPDCLNAINPADPEERCILNERVPDEYNFCSDNRDNDGDGLIDCDETTECGTFITCDPLNLCPGHERNPGEGACPEGCTDADGDLVCDDVDNCLNLSNPTQSDRNDNGVGDACDAFLQTTKGALYGRGFRSPVPPPPDVPNATFCILSSGAIQNFTVGTCALSADSQENVKEFRLYQYTDTLALWSDALRARLDLYALKQDALPLPEVAGGISWTSLGDASTGGNIYTYRGDLTVNSEIIWENGARLGTRTIIVEGNLTIAASSHYASGSVQSGGSIRELASVAWIVVDNPDTNKVVEGNITIDAAVGGDTSEDVVGAFVASGKIATGSSDLPLTVKGLMAARSFAFTREYASRTQGAELIIYDGRAVFNPPKGFEDFIKGLPVTRAVVPTQ